jgi:hypothetical protein
VGKDYRIPIHTDSGVIEAVHRQCLRIADIPDILDKHYLFRDDKGLLSSTAIRMALRKLSKHLTHEGQPYVIAMHQFRRTLSQNAFVLGTFMGHTNPSVCKYYLPPSRSLFLKELDRLQEKLDKFQQDEEQPSEAEQSGQEDEQQDEEQEGKEE